MPPTADSRRFYIRGRVQGVGFRDFTCRRAEALRLTGWVRNCPDGSVEAHAEGASESLDRFRRELEQGPPLARVADVEERPAPRETPNGFSVVR